MNGSKYFNFIIIAFVVLATTAFIISRCVSKVPDIDDIAHIRENGALRVVIDPSTDGMQITAEGDTVGEQFELIMSFAVSRICLWNINLKATLIMRLRIFRMEIAT